MNMAPRFSPESANKMHPTTTTHLSLYGYVYEEARLDAKLLQKETVVSLRAGKKVCTINNENERSQESGGGGETDAKRTS